MKSRRIRDLGEGEAPAYVPGGNLVSVAANGSLVAQPFDLESATATGPPQVLAADLSRAIDYAVSERGMLVYRSGTLSGTMSVADRAGVEKVLPFTVDGATHYDNPRYSPDGRRLVVSAGFSPGHKLVVLDLVTGTSLLMTFSGNSEFADWTPDGRSIVYVKDDSLVAEQPADRSAPERVLLSAGGNEIARVSVAGPWLAYAVRPRILTRGGPDARRSSNVFIVPRDGSGEPRAYQASGFGVYAPALSPGGERLAFVSDETGRPEVYIGSVPVAGGRQAVSPGGGREPVWSRDGRTLYYRTLARDLVAVDVGSGPGSAVTSRRTLFKGNAELSPDGSDFDVHPTNGSFLLLRSRTVDTELVVVTDAFGRRPQAP